MWLNPSIERSGERRSCATDALTASSSSFFRASSLTVTCNSSVCASSSVACEQQNGIERCSQRRASTDVGRERARITGQEVAAHTGLAIECQELGTPSFADDLAAPVGFA